jgi:membrane-associated phospholipid phosphatase
VLRGKSALLLAVIGLWTASAANAEDFELANVWSDTTHYFTSPLHWDRTGWETFGATVAAVVVAHQLDGRTRDHFAGANPVLDGKDTHSTRDAIPAAVLVGGTFILGLTLNEQAGRNEAYRMLEAAAFGGVTSELFRFAGGRERPDETHSPNAWRKGGNSFPSMHSTMAGAIGTVFAESGPTEYRWLRRIIGYGVVGYTAYSRLHDNAHWLSDVVAGTAVGVYSGAYTLGRQYSHHELSFNLSPGEAGGVMLQFTYTPCPSVN